LEADEGGPGCRAPSAEVCGADSGVRPAQQPGAWAGRQENEDTGQLTRGQSRNIPQCLAVPRLTGVFYPCALVERVRQRLHHWTWVARTSSATAFRSTQASQRSLFVLQASRLFRQVRCQDDRGSYPRPVPEQYRLAQKLRAATDSRSALLEVPPSGRVLEHPPCHLCVQRND